MELVRDIANNHYALYIPVALVLLGAVLVFVFGFKSAERPPFNKLTAEDRKQTVGKKKKQKEKKGTANGFVTVTDVKVDRSPLKEAKRSPSKEVQLKQSKEKKQETNTSTQIEKSNKNVKSKETTEEIKNRKNLKSKPQVVKPIDFDDGDWETVPTKNDKKKKILESPTKKEKKLKKIDITDVKTDIADKSIKEEVNKQLKKKDDEIKGKDVEVVLIPVSETETNNVFDDNKSSKKLIKAESNDNSLLENVEDIHPTKIEKKRSEEKLVGSKIETAVGKVAFDELEDVWKEAKTIKKSKKKTRRDN